jgi:hypothetical protein
MGCTSIAPPFHGGNTQFAADGLPVVLIGLNDLVEMAQSKGDTATATWAPNIGGVDRKIRARLVDTGRRAFCGFSRFGPAGVDRSYRYDRYGSAVHAVPAALLDKRYPDGDGNRAGPGCGNGIRKPEPSGIICLHRNDRVLSGRPELPQIQGSR